MVWTT